MLFLGQKLINEVLEYLAFRQRDDEFVYDDREAAGKYFDIEENRLLVV
ncbi:hypothetical protein [Haladaptatus pallidirubidus]|uniref:Uncharacterized protein n=1 Tax=Haladaptatus pallidirubidus TaxID=1008152 RepID=A0AAV3URW1_9EURY|nr:hypothetical protein [Haladaptatus pallidirubidus]